MLAAELRTERAKSEALATTVAEKEALMIEWMHSNESFKRLVQKYGKKLSIAEDQQQTDYRHEVLDTSKENPKYAGTGLVGRVKAKLAATK